MTYYTRLVRGFTAMEMLFVIAIISILAGVILGNLWGATDDSKAKKAEVDLKQMQLAMRLYVEQGHSSYPPGVDNCSYCEFRDGGDPVTEWRTVVDDSNGLLSESYYEDPWGNPYAYDNNLGVANPTLYTLLCSLGPNGTLDSGTTNGHSKTGPIPTGSGDDICIFF